MSTASALTRDILVETFNGYGRPRDNWLVGAELERHLLLGNGHPLPYFGEPSVRWVMERFAEEGWDPYFEGDNPISLTKNGASITLEPGGQFELSGAPSASLQAIHDEGAQFIRDIDRLFGDHDVNQVAMGFTPYAKIPEIGWVPKGRYVTMRSHLAQTGELAHDMMKGTCAVQASYDFEDEADAAAKVELATRIGPLTTALFANSPYRHGKLSGWASWRGHAWTKTDPRRTGFPEAAIDFTYERWLDYLLDAPMMFVKDADGNWVAAHGRTFRQWLDSDNPPTMADWDLHMTSVFPEVRIKQQIEVRGADCVSQELGMAFVALFKGLFYCALATRQALEFSLRFAQTGTREERFHIACKDGLKGSVGNRLYADWAYELLVIADEALERCAPEDRHWLVPLKAQVEAGESPAHTMVRMLGETPDPRELMAFTHPLVTR